jgi:hypothetical protein
MKSLDRNKLRMLSPWFLTLAALMTLTKSIPIANAELQALPSRIHLSEEQKTAQVSLMNKGAKSARYRIDALPYRMKKDGSLEVLRDPTKAERSAVDFFRYSPRQVTVEPNSEQVVRLQLKWPEKGPEKGPEKDSVETPADADYYAYLSIEAVEEEDESNAIRPSANAQALPQEPPTLIPVVVRRGTPELKVTLENFKTTVAPDKTISYSVDVVKTGTAILQADFVLLYFIEGVEKPTTVAQSNGVTSVIERRTFTQTLSIAQFSKGKLVLEVRESLSDGAKLLASASLETLAPVSSPTPSRLPSSSKRKRSQKGLRHSGVHTPSSSGPLNSADFS